MTLILHHCHEARSMRSLWLIHELGLDVEVIVHPFGRELRDPAYLAVHPLGRVPALVDGPVTLFESGAIAEYLCETYGRDSGLWRALGTPERAEWLQWLHYAETVSVHVASLTQQILVITDPALQSPTLVKLETRRLEKALGVVEDRLVGRDHLLASGFSAVDVGVGYSIHIARLFTDLAAFPRVAAYYARLSERPAFRASLPAPDAAHRIYTRERYFEPS